MDRMEMNSGRISVKEARDKAMKWCSRREYCSKGMFDKAVSWGCTSGEAEETVKFLVEQKFVDDRRYTEAWVKDKLNFNRWGKVKMSYILHVQNIDPALIREILSGIDQTEYEKILASELSKKKKTIRQGNVFEVRGKLFRFAASRGFEPEVIHKTLVDICGL